MPQESLGVSHFELPLAVIRRAWTDEEAQEEVKMTTESVTDLINKLEEMCGLAKDNLSESAARYADVFDGRL